jgi:hypothetical protein
MGSVTQGGRHDHSLATILQKIADNVHINIVNNKTIHSSDHQRYIDPPLTSLYI